MSRTQAVVNPYYSDQAGNLLIEVSFDKKGNEAVLDILDELLEQEPSLARVTSGRTDFDAWWAFKPSDSLEDPRETLYELAMEATRCLMRRRTPILAWRRIYDVSWRRAG